MNLRRCKPEGNKYSKGQSVSVARKWFLICSFAALYLPILEASTISAELPNLNLSCSPLLAANGIYHPWQSSYPVSSWHSQELEYADCRPQKMLHEVGAVRLTDPKARSKIKQSLLGIIRGLALLLYYGMSFVYCTLFLTTICANLSSEFVGDAKIVRLSEFQSFNEAKKELLVTVLFLLIILQYYWIDCALQGAHTCTKSYKYCVCVYDHHVSKAITICPLSVLSLRLLLSGDVETNPGPVYGQRRRSHRRANSLDTSIELHMEFICDHIGNVAAKCSQHYLKYLKELNGVAVKPIKRTLSGWSLIKNEQSAYISQLYISIDIKKMKEFERLVFFIFNLEKGVKECIKQASRYIENRDIDYLPANSKIRTRNAAKKSEEIQKELSQLKKSLCQSSSTAKLDQVEAHVYYQLSIYLINIRIVKKCGMMLKKVSRQYSESSIKMPADKDVTYNVSDLDEDVQKLIRRYLESCSYELEYPFILSFYQSDLSALIKKKYELHPDRRIDSGSMEYGHLLLLLNQMYIHTPLGENIYKNIPCAFCCSKRPINSHIWPRALFRAYKKIHGDDTSKEFQLSINNDVDPSFKIIGLEKIAVHILCGECDAKTSGEENMLSRHYSFFSAYPKHRLKFKNSKSWFQRILAVIMVKGILMNCNLLKERRNASYTKFLDLIQLAISPTQYAPPKLCVFLLPHSLYSNLDIFSSFERQLRYPSFPSICDLQEIGEKGRFYYMQFDCMHVVCPIDDGSAKYFQSFQDFWDSRDMNCFPSTLLRKMAFPPALLAINLVRAIDTARGMMTILPNSQSPKYQRMLALVQHYRKWTLFPTKKVHEEVPQYNVLITDRDNMEYQVICYEEECAKLEGDFSELTMRSFVRKCNVRAHRTSILQAVSMYRKCHRVQPEQLLQMREENRELLKKLDQLFDNVKERLISPKENEIEYLSMWISDCKNTFEKHLKTKYHSLRAPLSIEETVIISVQKYPIQETGDNDNNDHVEPQSEPVPRSLRHH